MSKMFVTNTNISCGIKQIWGLHDEEGKTGSKEEYLKKNLIRLMKGCNRVTCECHQEGHPGYTNSSRNSYCKKCFGSYVREESTPVSIMPGFIYLFSDNSVRKNGEALAKFIRDNDMGELLDSGEYTPNRNMSDTTRIKMWTWRPNGNLPK
jgi:hypothetical protein